MGYRFKKPPVFKGLGKLFYGIENEYEFLSTDYKAQTDAMRQFAAKEPDFYHLTHDGTLKYGVELVTQPASFDVWRDRPYILPADVTNRVDKGTAGCHIHISKEAFHEYHLFKFLKFLTEQFENFVNVFGRGVTEYGSRQCEQINEELVVYARKGTSPTKYWWINMINKSTVEIRVFLAAEDDATIYSYLQLLHSVYYYTMSRKPRALNWKEYYLWLRDKKDYQLLAEQLEKKPKPKSYGVPIPVNKQKKGRLTRRTGVGIDTTPAPDATWWPEDEANTTTTERLRW
jgi:hypothetical protein